MGVPFYAEQVPWMVGDDAQGFPFLPFQLPLVYVIQSKSLA
jgi:hypothetical protein